MRRRVRIAWWAVRRHPRQLLRIVRFAARHRKAVATGRRVIDLPARVRAAATDPEAQGEARLAVSAISRAAQRVADVGMAEALADKTVIDQLRRAAAHASNVASATASPPRRRRAISRPAAIAVGACFLAGAIYVGGRRYARAR
jgi:hypothetical protein